jgi:CheY-like chemotaxis protein
MSKKGPILLVEDDPDDQQFIIDILKDLGIPNEVTCFTNGHEAYSYLTSSIESPFLILCDINMPVMGGIELRRHITGNESLRRKSIPFIFLTTTANPSAVKEAYEMSVQGFFEKSISIKDFKQLVSLIYKYWQQCKHPNG